MFLLLVAAMVSKGPVRVLLWLARVGLGLVALVVWLAVLLARPAAGGLLFVAAVTVVVVWRMRARVWALMWDLWGDRLRSLIPPQVIVALHRRGWPEVADRVGLTVTTSAKRVEYMPGKWTPTVTGWTVTGRICDGQTVESYAKAAEMLAAAWTAEQVSVLAPSPGYVTLRVHLVDPLAVPVRPALLDAVPSLEALRLGLDESGAEWVERLTGRHIFVAGSTGAGKGSVQWSVIRAVAPLVRIGLVQVWTLDPKRVEFASGRGLFARYATDPGEMVAVMEEAAGLVHARADRQAGVSRTHTATTAEPLVLVNVDEVAFLTSYVPDRELRDRFTAAMAVVLTQGRALGVVVMAAVQDPRKEVMPLRDLFTTRVALRLDGASQVDLVLGDGASKRGAAAHRISQDERRGAGIGYVAVEGNPVPRRVRAAYVDDAEIQRLVTHYGTPPDEGDDAAAPGPDGSTGNADGNGNGDPGTGPPGHGVGFGFG